jgi:hypothetical protein
MKNFAIFLLQLCFLYSESFQSSSFPSINSSRSASNSKLHNIFGNLFGEKSSQPIDEENKQSFANTGPVASIFTIPTKEIKSKPLRFYLQLFLVSQQNFPVKGSWLLATNEEDTERLDLYYADGTGMVSILLDDNGIIVRRQGKRPSLQYMLQESVLLHKLVDEIEQIAFGDGNEGGNNDNLIVDEKRLIQFASENNNVLTEVRKNLPARQERS